MSRLSALSILAVVELVGLTGCATRPVNPTIKEVDAQGGYTFLNRQKYFRSQDTLVCRTRPSAEMPRGRYTVAIDDGNFNAQRARAYRQVLMSPVTHSQASRLLRAPAAFESAVCR